MQERLRIDIELSALATQHGGRSSPITTGYRPLCIFVDDGEKVTIGLCELETPVPIEPGRSGRGTLIFDERVASEARQAAKEGVAFEMAEGDHVVATARVLRVR